MGEHAGEHEAPPPAPFTPAPTPLDLQQFYTRADAALAELVLWIDPLAKAFGVGYVPGPGAEPKA